MLISQIKKIAEYSNSILSFNILLIKLTNKGVPIKVNIIAPIAPDIVLFGLIAVNFVPPIDLPIM